MFLSYYRSAYESLVMKDSLAKIISSEAFTLNTTSIINFNHLKEKVFSEIANLNHLVGVQVFAFAIRFYLKSNNDKSKCDNIKVEKVPSTQSNP
jgi:hypothetical protein